eukprot:s189_g7.t1
MAEPSKRQRLASARFTEVAVALEAYFDGLHNGDVERFKEVWHPEGHLYWISPEGDLVDRTAEEFLAYVEGNKKSPHLAEYDQIIRLDFASDRCCCAKVQIALSAESGERRYTDLLVLLRLHGKWQIISKVFSSVPLTELSYEERQDDLPFTAGEPVRGVLEYYRGGHLSRPEIIQENFHSSARLTFSNDSEELVCWSQQQFFEVIQGMPATFADSNALRFDKILSVDKAGPDVAMIKLQIGYPPVLYTDFLSMFRLRGNRSPKLNLAAAFQSSKGHAGGCDCCDPLFPPAEMAYGEETVETPTEWLSGGEDMPPPPPVRLPLLSATMRKTVHASPKPRAPDRLPPI